MEDLIKKISIAKERRDKIIKESNEIIREVKNGSGLYFLAEQSGSSIVFKSDYLGLEIKMSFEDIIANAQAEGISTKVYMINELINSL